MIRIAPTALTLALFASACTGGSSAQPSASNVTSVPSPSPTPAADAAKVLSATEVGPEPSTVVAAEGSIWVASDIGVTRIDPSTGAITASVTVGGEADVASSGDQLWIDSYSSNAVGLVDTNTNTVTTTTKVGAPTGIAVGEGAVWVMSLRDGLISRLDPETGKVVATIPVKGASRRFPLGFGPRPGPGVAAGAGAVWAVVPSSGQLVRLDPSTNQAKTFGVGGQPVGVAVFDDAVWVIDSHPHSVLRIDPSNGKVEATIKLPSMPLGIGGGPDGLWVTGLDMIASIDPSTNALTGVRTLGGKEGAGVSEASGKLWTSLAVAPDPDKQYYNPDARLLAIDPTATGDPVAPSTMTAVPGDLPVTITRDVPFTPELECLGDRCETGQLQLDVYAPVEPGPWPVVVMAHGGPCGIGCRNYLAKQASVLAIDGAVVFNTDYRDDMPDAEAGDIACAVNFARGVAADYGGDPSSVTLVGHSNGAFQGIDAAVLGDTYDGPCIGTGSSSVPDAFVGVAGGRLESYIVNKLDANPDLVVRLVIGTNDNRVAVSDPQLLQQALKKAGFDSTFTLVKGANHFSVFDPGTASPTFALIFAVMDALAKR